MYDKAKQKLEELKAELDNRISEIKKSLTGTRSKDWEEAAVEAENDEVLEEIYAEAQAELMQVQFALKRIDNNEYEDCAECGEEINKQRLEIMPYTTLCIKCAQKLEMQHTHNH